MTTQTGSAPFTGSIGAPEVRPRPCWLRGVDNSASAESPAPAGSTGLVRCGIELPQGLKGGGSNPLRPRECQALFCSDRLHGPPTLNTVRRRAKVHCLERNPRQRRGTTGSADPPPFRFPPARALGRAPRSGSEFAPARRCGAAPPRPKRRSPFAPPAGWARWADRRRR